MENREWMRIEWRTTKSSLYDTFLETNTIESRRKVAENNIGRKAG